MVMAFVAGCITGGVIVVLAVLVLIAYSAVVVGGRSDDRRGLL